ncbi:MAG: DUF4417 domain-containing protein, partial [Spirochaetales bacterium]|nr:DUF4417 domain-containing protein [Candidatus Physcosoma equi]
ITPDFSTNQDFPEAIKIYATYRMRAFGYWLGREGIEVINPDASSSPRIVTHRHFPDVPSAVIHYFYTPSNMNI